MSSWKPTIAATDSDTVVQLKRLLGEMVDEIRSLQKEARARRTFAGDWVRPTSAESNPAYMLGLSRANVWVNPPSMRKVLDGDSPTATGVLCLFPAPAIAAYNNAGAHPAERVYMDVSAAQDGSMVEDVWVTAPALSWDAGTYVSASQDGGLVRLTPPAEGAYFLAAVDGEIFWYEAEECE